jgi:hypothetical protein
MLATGFLSASMAPAIAIGPSVSISTENESDDDGSKLTKEQKQAERQAKEAERAAREAQKAIDADRDIEDRKPNGDKGLKKPNDSIALPPVVIKPAKPSKSAKPAKPIKKTTDGTASTEASSSTNSANIGSPVQAGGANKASVGSPASSIGSGAEGKESISEPENGLIEPEEGQLGRGKTEIDPVANVPIELSKVQPTKKTPADTFVESATVGVGAMAAGAAVLATVAFTRGSRARRQKSGDYLYSSDN